MHAFQTVTIQGMTAAVCVLCGAAFRVGVHIAIPPCPGDTRRAESEPPTAMIAAEDHDA